MSKLMSWFGKLGQMLFQRYDRGALTMTYKPLPATIRAFSTNLR